MGDEIAVLVELGHEELGCATVGVNAKLEDGVVVGTYKEHTWAWLVVNGNESSGTRQQFVFDGSNEQCMCEARSTYLGNSDSVRNLDGVRHRC